MWTIEGGGRKGGALLTVLWLSAALSTIAFSVANTVRGETQRVSTAAEGVRAYYLAAGAVERAMLYLMWGQGHRRPDRSPRYYAPETPVLRMAFPSGEAVVEVIPEASKLNINSAPREELGRLFLAAGLEPERAQVLADAIVDWRTPLPPFQTSPFDQTYLARNPSFRSSHASFVEIEELLLVQGMTPDLFYGTWRRDAAGRLTPVGGLRDCLTIYGPSSQMDVNTVHPLILQAFGMSPEAVAGLVGRRQMAPIRDMGSLAALGVPPQLIGRLRVGGNAIFTFRATATVRLPNGQMSDIRRSVAATVKYNFSVKDAIRPFDVLRWQDNAGYR